MKVIAGRQPLLTITTGARERVAGCLLSSLLLIGSGGCDCEPSVDQAARPRPSARTGPSTSSEPRTQSPELIAALEKHGRSKLQNGFDALPSEQCANGFKVKDLGDFGKFYIEPGTRDVIKGELLKGKVWEPHLQPLFELYVKPGSTVVDVGAHIGTHVVTLSNLVGPEGHVIAFEPQTKMFNELRCNLSLNGVTNATPLPTALGDAFGEIEMAAPVRENEGGIGLGKGGNKAELRPLDSYEFEKLSVLKIDVEGFEDFVLEGARQTILKHKPVIFIEIMGGHNWDAAPPEIRARIKNTAMLVTEMGYRVDRVGVFDYIAQVKGSPPPPRPMDDPTRPSAAPP